MNTEELLKQNSIAWNGKTLTRNGTNTATDREVIDGIARGAGISVEAITDAARREYENSRRAAAQGYTNMLSNLGGVSTPQQICTAQLNKYLPARFREGFNEKDREVFSNIYFSMDVDSIHMYCRRNEDSWEMAEIPLQTATDRAPGIRISAILSQCTRNGGSDTVANLMNSRHNAICSEFKKIIDSVHETPDSSAWDALGKAAKDLFPVAYFAAGGIYVQYEKRTEHFNNAGTEQQGSVAYLIRGFFSLRGNQMNGPVDLLAENPSVLLRDPERIIPMPVPFTNDKNVKALRYIDLSTVCKKGPHPRWDFYWKRYTPAEAKVYKAFIWSIFKADSRGRQMLYIYDPQGYSGKSVVTNVIAKFVGEGFVQNLQKDSLTNQFAFSKIYNKRLVVYSDNKNPSLARSEKFHLITGHDFVEVERKGSSSFNYRLNLKVIANGNTALTIDTSALHEKTRVIILTPHVNNEILREICVCGPDGNPIRCPDGSPKFIGDSSFEDQLLEEFPAMLEECRDAYAELCPTDSDLILPNELYEEIDALESDEISMFNYIIDTYFSVGPEKEITPADLCRVFDSAVRSLTASGETPLKVEYDDFVEHLRKKLPNFHKKRTHSGPRVYTGIAEKQLPRIAPTKFSAPDPEMENIL